MSADQTNQTSTAQGRPRRRGFFLAAFIYAAWLVFLFTLGLMQPHVERPAAPASPPEQPSPLAPKTAPQATTPGS